jgi:hypothetical protein
MIPTDRAARIRGIAVVGGLIAFLALLAPLVGQQPSKSVSKPVEKELFGEPGKTGNEPLPTYAHFHDGSVLKLTLREERIEFVTPYGKQLIPVTDIRRIDFGLHIDAATAKLVEAAITGLGSGDSKERATAATALLDLGEFAYPALVEASKSKDVEVAQRAEAILNKLREKLPSDRLERPANDVVETADCRFTGRIAAEVFKVRTSQFGDQQVKLGDLAALGPKALVDPESIIVEQTLPFGPGGFGPGGGVWVGPGPGGAAPRRIRGGPLPALPGGLQPPGPRGPGGVAPGGDPLPGGAPPPKPPRE